MKKNIFELRVSSCVHYKGSLVDCFLNAYGLSDFVILNHSGFCFTFRHDDIGCDDYEKDHNYDTNFYFELKQILTDKELNKFKIKFRTYFRYDR